ncbi:hypothetical protein Acsp06_54070 [Actinomycetospora sp. NBRC 106375]|uniref:hypothetical protein n=1 Tax=Actinomycetospora sp. NBRC 106375 TaxID=3032207 RepID=UPI0024A46D09|nr:hypothetical protein [Actinomycetospora sp. NBRC 106375]GLZ49222.1 hypothetical protein Acsp06_54070 [Actinomycetospora sp. NBRC 106375]
MSAQQGVSVAGDIAIPLIVNLASNLIGFLIGALWTSRRRTQNLRRRRSKIIQLLGFVVFGLASAISASLIVRWNESPWLGIVLLVAGVLVTSGGLAWPYLKFWWVGVGGVDLKMRTGLHPKKALRSCTSGLSFLGTGASKLTSNADTFAQTVAACTASGNTVRLLLSRPDSANLRTAAQRANKPEEQFADAVKGSLQVIADLKLKRKFDIEVRFYDNATLFRLMFINERVCVFSYNVYGTEDEMAVPQLFFSKDASKETKSFYWGFERYFERQWDDAIEWNYSDFI